MDRHTPMAVLAAYQAAVFERDATAFLRLYAPDARVFDTWGVWSYEGTAARRASIEGWFSSLGDERVAVTFEDVHVVAVDAMAVLTATGRYAAQAPDGAALRAMQNRFTWALALAGGAWSIVHEHTSAPIGFGDLKGMLQKPAH